MVEMVAVEREERRETEGMVVGVDGREEGVEMMAVGLGRECMERASGREESLEETRDTVLFLTHVRTSSPVVAWVEFGLGAFTGALRDGMFEGLPKMSVCDLIIPSSPFSLLYDKIPSFAFSGTCELLGSVNEVEPHNHPVIDSWSDCRKAFDNH